MQNVVGVRFLEAGKIYYFSPAGFEDVEVAEYVVVETSRGLEIARVVIAPHQVVNAELSEVLKPIVRMAFQEDIERMEILRAQAEVDLAHVRTAVSGLRLPLKIVNGSYNLDGTRLTVYFNPDGESRVDLRELLSLVQDDLHVMVQLRQVGPRDQAKAVGGYGICGRRLCCSSWLTAFPSISVRMAKEQNQPPNPTKISGQCGRLLCCLAYENDMYKQLRAELPRVGTLVSTPAGDARVVGVNALRQSVALQMADFKVVELPASALAMERGVVRVIEAPEDERAAATVAAMSPAATPPPPPRAEPRQSPPPIRRDGPRPPPQEHQDQPDQQARPDPTGRRERPPRPAPPPAGQAPRPTPLASQPQPRPPVGGDEIEQPHASTVASEPGMESADEDARRKRRRRRPRHPGEDLPPSPIT